MHGTFTGQIAHMHQYNFKFSSFMQQHLSDMILQMTKHKQIQVLTSEKTETNDNQIQIFAGKNTQKTFVLLNPSPNRMISAIRVESGTTIDIGRNIDLRLSGSSVLPAYPGFIVMKMPQDHSSLISRPSKTNRWIPLDRADMMDKICWATTDRTSMLIRLNSSKQPQAPVCYVTTMPSAQTTNTIIFNSYSYIYKTIIHKNTSMSVLKNWHGIQPVYCMAPHRKIMKKYAKNK